MWTKSYDLTIQMKALCLNSNMVLFVVQNFYKMKFGNLVEICLWLDLAVKGLKEGINDTVDTKGGTLKVNVNVRPHYYYY